MRTVPAFVTLLSASFLASHVAGQVTGREIYEFSGSQYQPLGVVAGPDGVLYGMVGGGNGSVFELQPPATPGGSWTETVLYSFTGQNGDGWNEWPSLGILTVDSSGNIYGTTNGGGTYNAGIVFELQPPLASGGAWTETVLYSFPPNGGLGGFASTEMVIVEHGVLYGVYTAGGDYGLGMVFELRPPASSSGGPWVFTTLYSFTGGGDGAFPAVLTRGPGGVLYGLAGAGGSTGQGAVFELSPPVVPGQAWTEKVLYNLLGGKAGYGAVGLVMGSDGSLYGLSVSTVFQLTPTVTGSTAWTETTLYSLGEADSTIVERNGTIYVTTWGGNLSFGGNLYQLQQSQGGGPWIATLIHQFYGYGVPWGSLVLNQNGTLLGACLAGFIYELKP